MGLELNVLVIDDSAYARVALRGMMETMDGFSATVSTAVDGLDGYRQAIKREPDLIMLDLEMPEMDGFTFLRLIRGSSVPVIVVSGTGSEDSASKALELGASAYIEKPSLSTPDRLFSIKGEISEKVNAIRFPASSERKGRFKASDIYIGAPEAVIIGASTGGPRAVTSLIKTLPAGLPSVFVVSMHMPPWLTVPFAERLDAQSLLPVKVARDGTAVEKGEVLVAPGGHHISFLRTGGRVVSRLKPAEPADLYSPSIDLAFSSGALVWGGRLVGAVMTGMGEDGSKGIVNIKENGGVVLAEARESAVVYSMPEAAMATGMVDRVLSSRDMGEWIARRSGRGSIKLA
ncbi:MAG: chemotaxis protein CheB [Deltaproteobacteria bacterium]|nr:chemotaxis protein CheB [Deltaproteobacteria bacterium]